MAVQPQQLDPLPIPQLDQTAAQNPLTPPEAKPLPQEAGWVKPSGAGAYIAYNFLTGWMAGRQHHQQQALQKAQLDVQGATTTYDVTAQNYQNLIDQGLDPNKPEDAQKLNAAKTAASAAWNNYLDRAQKYSTPDEGGKPKKKGLKDKAHDAFMGQDPQFFVDSSLKVLRDSGAPVLSYGTSKDEKQKQQLQEQTLKQNENILKQQAHDSAQTADIDTLRKQYKDAVDKGDQAGARKAREALAGYGVNIQRVESDAEAQAADEVAKAKLDGIKTLNTPGKTTSDLTVAQRAALGVQLGPLDAYLNEVGPGKKFKNAIDANKAYLHDQASAQAIAGVSAQERQWRQMEHAEAVVLQHELQDPATARRYGLAGPLKPGDKVPDWLIQKAVTGRLHPSPEERAEAKLNVDKSISGAINNTLQYGLDAKTAAWARDNLIDIDPQTHTMSLKPYLPEKQSHWFKGDTMGGLTVDEFNKKRQGVLQILASYIRKTNPEASADRIMSALNSEDPGSYFLDNSEPADKTPTPGADRSMTPPPSPRSWEQVGGGEGPKHKYHVEANGQVNEMELTPEEAEYIKQTHPDVKVDFVSSPQIPHGR